MDHLPELKVSISKGVQIKEHSPIKCKIINNSEHLQVMVLVSVKEAVVFKPLEWLDQKKREHLYKTNKIITILREFGDDHTTCYIDLLPIFLSYLFVIASIIIGTSIVKFVRISKLFICNLINYQLNSPI